MTIKKVFFVISLFLFTLLLLITTHTQQTTLAAGTITGLKVQGNHIINGSGQTVQLRGVSISGTEVFCAQNGYIFNGPADQGLQAMLTWHINVVRIPLNEDCWLGINGAKIGGVAYQQAITTFVNQVNANGMAAILDLHWSAPGSTLATGQQKMADADHSIAFWTSIASSFKSNSSVIFELYNEPNSIDWNCWKNGGNCAGFPTAGMQQMLDAIRGTGATNIVVMGGLAYSNDLSQWLANKPTDPLNNIGATWHVYNFNTCNNTSCWDSQVGPVAQQVPIIATEVAEKDCSATFVDQVLNWLDAHNQNYIGWAWFPGGCGFPSLISDYNGTPTIMGQGFKNHLAQVGGTPMPTSPYVTPTIYCLGSCLHPTLTPMPSGMIMPGTPTPILPLPTPFTSISLSQTPSSSPCQVSSSIQSTTAIQQTQAKKNRHHKKNQKQNNNNNDKREDLLEELIAIIKKLLELIEKLIGTTPPPSGTPCPTPTPVISSVPSTTMSMTPSTTLSQAPTPIPSGPTATPILSTSPSTIPSITDTPTPILSTSPTTIPSGAVTDTPTPILSTSPSSTLSQAPTPTLYMNPSQSISQSPSQTPITTPTPNNNPVTSIINAFLHLINSILNLFLHLFKTK